MTDYQIDPRVLDAIAHERKRQIAKWGAVVMGEDIPTGDAFVEFFVDGLRARLMMQMPTHDQYARTPGGKKRNRVAQQSVWEEVCKERWRAMVRVVNAKLVAVEAGITTVEHEFMADIVLADGRRLAEHVQPQITEARQTPIALPAGRR